MHRLGYNNLVFVKKYIKTGNISHACVQFLYVGFHSLLRKKNWESPSTSRQLLRYMISLIHESFYSALFSSASTSSENILITPLPTSCTVYFNDFY
jgi:hypothetical protein